MSDLVGNLKDWFSRVAAHVSHIARKLVFGDFSKDTNQSVQPQELARVRFLDKETTYTSQEHLRTKVTPDLHLIYSKNGGNLGLVLK